MTPLEKIKSRCHIDDITGCWVWKGAVSRSNGGQFNQPRVYSEDYTADATGKTKVVQTGNRAAWHAATGKPIPNGHRVYKSARCTNGLCVNPAHLECGTTADWGAAVAKKGHWKGVNDRIQANRAIARTKTEVTPELAREILASHETGRAISCRLKLHVSIVSRVRTGQLVSVLTQGNPFAGLMT